jgi:hypothetical protein
MADRFLLLLGLNIENRDAESLQESGKAFPLCNL